ncbi:MAG: hypothetical protein HRF51_07890 [bacterium]|jgi:hypothetical protein
MSRFKRYIFIVITLVAASALATPACASDGVQLDLESGVAISGYNDVRYPGNSGTLISLSQDLNLEQGPFWRARISYGFGDRHTLSLLAAPLRLEGKGAVSNDIIFGAATFPAMTALKTKYRFDSYRMTYRYEILRRDQLSLGIGFTGKIRDAAISIQGNGLASEKANTGFVPLINFRFDLKISRMFSLLVDGDALAAPQGRAEDVLAAITADTAYGIKVKLGYRILEGGADNDEIYTFALVNYLVLGVGWQF